MTGAGKRKERVTFQIRALDANGDRSGAWGGDITRWARVKPMRGGEGPLQGRLQGKRLVEIYVLNDSGTDDITNEYRATWNGAKYNVRDVQPTEDRAEFVILAEADQSDE